MLDIQSRSPGLLHARAAEHSDAAGEPAGGRDRECAIVSARCGAQADTLLLLNEVGRETSSILDVEELMRRAAEQTKRVIDYQILSIMLYDEEQKVFRHRLDVKHGQRVQGKLRAALARESSARRLL